MHASGELTSHAQLSEVDMYDEWEHFRSQAYALAIPSETELTDNRNALYLGSSVLIEKCKHATIDEAHS